MLVDSVIGPQSSTHGEAHSFDAAFGEFVGVLVIDSDAVDGADFAFAAGDRLLKPPQGRATRHH